MVNKVNKDAFKRLKKLHPRKRLETAKSPIGQSMLSLLTPSQFAELFPRYYEQGLPDVEGFRKAISKKSQEKQQEYFDSLDEKLGTTSPGGGRGRAAGQGSTGRGGGGGSGSGYARVGASGQAVAVDVGKRLMRDYGLTDYQAAGVLAHLGHESAGFQVGIQEGKPIAGRGGFGLAQWTGARRVALENFAAKNGMNIADVNTQYAFMVQEGEFKKYIGAVKNSRSMEEAAQAFSPYESGGDPRWVAAWGSRYQYGRSALSWLSGKDTGSREAQGATPAEGFVAHNSGGNFNGQGFVGLGNKFQCVQYARSVGGLGHTSGWTPGQKAMGGGLKPGDWLARFNSDGSYGNQPGYSHVARFEGYKRDEKGNILGMYVTQQYGHTKVHSAFIPSGGNNPEFDANNYHHIHDQGKPASMHTSDGSDEKVKSREEHFKNHPNDIEPETHVKVKPQQQVQPPPPMPHPSASLGNETQFQTATVNKTRSADGEATFQTASMSSADYLTSRSGRNGRDDLKGLAQYASAETTMNDAGVTVKSRPSLIDYTSSKTVDAIGISHEHYGAFRKAIAGIESSGGRYDLRGGSNKRFAGAYQMGGEEIKIAAKILGEKAPIIKRGRAKPVGNDQFLNDPNMQERYFDAFVYAHHKDLMNRSKKYAELPPEEKMKVLAYAHNQGAGGASKWLRTGKVGHDAFGTKGTKYATAVGKEFGNISQQPKVETAQAASPAPGVIPMESTVNRGVVTPTTPKPTVEPPKPPSTTDRIAKEIFQGGGKGAEAAPAKPTTTTPTTTSATTPVAPPAPATPNAIRTEPVLNVDNPVRGASDGGSFDANGTVSIRPMDRKDDHALISNNGGRDQVIGTVQSGERIDVTPQQKVNGNMGPTDNGLRGEFEALRQEIGNNLSNAGEPVKQQPKTIQQKPDANVTKFNASLNEQNKTKQWHNDAFARAMARTRLQETGDTLNNHFSGGNTNYG